jgi:hypothetical protein
VKKKLHNPLVGKYGLKQSVWAKAGLLVLLVVGVLAVSAPQGGQPAGYLADGDKPKIGTGG